MKDKLIAVLVVSAWLAACARSGARSDQQNYEVVQEGSASGVTSTIHGPGEVLPPVTDTNFDTTTAFTIDPNAVPPVTTTQPGSIAGTRPPSVPPATIPRPQTDLPPTDTAPTTTQTDTTDPPTQTDTREPPPPRRPPPAG